MAGNDVFLYSVPSDANPNDVRLRDPTTSGSTTKNQSLAITLDDVTVAIAQAKAGGTNSQALAITLDDVAASVSQARQYSQALAATLDSVTVAVAQNAQHSQALAITLGDVTVAAAQELSHAQSLAITLDDVAVDIAQAIAGANDQTLALTLDDVSVSIAQQGTDLVKQGGLGKLKAQLRKTETEEQKRLRREAQGIIKRIKSSDDSEGLEAEAAGISSQLQQEIARLELAAGQYQAELFIKRELAQMQRIQSALIDVQLQAEAARQQVEELDVAFVMFMLAAHI